MPAEAITSASDELAEAPSAGHLDDEQEVPQTEVEKESTVKTPSPVCDSEGTPGYYLAKYGDGSVVDAAGLQLLVDDFIPKAAVVQSVKGHKNAERARITEEEFSLLDIDADGVLNRDEFYCFFYGKLYAMLHAFSASITEPSEAETLRRTGALYRMYSVYCSTSGSERTMTLRPWINLCKDTRLLAQHAAELVHVQARAAVVRRGEACSKSGVDFQEFMHALRLLGEKRRIGLSWVIDVVLYLGASNKSSLETSRYRGLILSSLTLDQGIFPMDLRPRDVVMPPVPKEFPTSPEKIHGETLTTKTRRQVAMETVLCRVRAVSREERMRQAERQREEARVAAQRREEGEEEVVGTGEDDEEEKEGEVMGEGTEAADGSQETAYQQHEEGTDARRLAPGDVDGVAAAAASVEMDASPSKGAAAAVEMDHTPPFPLGHGREGYEPTEEGSASQADKEEENAGFGAGLAEGESEEEEVDGAASRGMDNGVAQRGVARAQGISEGDGGSVKVRHEQDPVGERVPEVMGGTEDNEMKDVNEEPHDEGKGQWVGGGEGQLEGEKMEEAQETCEGEEEVRKGVDEEDRLVKGEEEEDASEGEGERVEGEEEVKERGEGGEEMGRQEGRDGMEKPGDNGGDYHLVEEENEGGKAGEEVKESEEVDSTDDAHGKPDLGDVVPHPSTEEGQNIEKGSVESFTPRDVESSAIAGQRDPEPTEPTAGADTGDAGSNGKSETNAGAASHSEAFAADARGAQLKEGLASSVPAPDAAAGEVGAEADPTMPTTAEPLPGSETQINTTLGEIVTDDNEIDEGVMRAKSLPADGDVASSEARDASGKEVRGFVSEAPAVSGERSDAEPPDGETLSRGVWNDVVPATRVEPEVLDGQSDVSEPAGALGADTGEEDVSLRQQATAVEPVAVSGMRSHKPVSVMSGADAGAVYQKALSSHSRASSVSDLATSRASGRSGADESRGAAVAGERTDGGGADDSAPSHDAPTRPAPPPPAPTNSSTGAFLKAAASKSASDPRSLHPVMDLDEPPAVLEPSRPRPRRQSQLT